MGLTYTHDRIKKGSPDYTLVNKTISITKDTTISGVIEFMPGKMYTVASGITLTLESPDKIKATPEQQIFTGDGSISFSNGGTVYPEWFGGIGDGSTNSSTSVEKAEASLTSGGWIEFTTGKTYLVDGALVNLPDVDRDGVSWYCYGATIKAPSTGKGYVISGFPGSHRYILGGTFDGNWDGLGGDIAADPPTSTGAYQVINMFDSTDSIIRDVTIRRSVADGFAAADSVRLLIDNVTIESSAEHGFYLSGYGLSDFRLLNSRVLNCGLNTWAKGSVYIKVRNADCGLVDNFYGRAPDAVDTGIKLTEVGTTNITWRNIDIDTGLDWIFIANDMVDNIFENCTFTAASGHATGTFATTSETAIKKIRNVSFKNYNSVQLFGDVSDVVIEYASGTIGLGFLSGSLYHKIRNLKILNSTSTMLATYGDILLLQNIDLLNDNAFTSIRLYSIDLTIDNLYMTSAGTGDIFEIRSCEVLKLSNSEITGGGLIRDDNQTATSTVVYIRNVQHINPLGFGIYLEGNSTAYIDGLSSINNNTSYLFVTVGSGIINYNNISLTGTATFSAGTGDSSMSAP